MKKDKNLNFCYKNQAGRGKKRNQNNMEGKCRGGGLVRLDWVRLGYIKKGEVGILQGKKRGVRGMKR